MCTSNEPKLTIITPSYNRAYTLPDVYQSLAAQTDQRFVWMVADDGSTDDTRALVQTWMDEGSLKIEYFYKENGGKASALNRAIDRLETEYAVCLDSDDTFYADAVEKALRALEPVASDPRCCGILAIKSNPDGTNMGGNRIPESVKTLTAADFFLTIAPHSEVACFYKTAILQKYRFPEFPGEKFVSPAWMQYRVTQDYYFVPSWEKYCKCAYLPDGLTRNKKRVILKNPRGYTSVKRFSFDLSPTLKQRVKHGIMYNYGCILSGDRNWLKNVRHKLLALVLRPAAYAVYLLRRARIKT